MREYLVFYLMFVYILTSVYNVFFSISGKRIFGRVINVYLYLQYLGGVSKMFCTIIATIPASILLRTGGLKTYNRVGECGMSFICKNIIDSILMVEHCLCILIWIG